MATEPSCFDPLWATIGASNQVNQHIGCSARSVKLVTKKQIFLILPDRDASAGLGAGAKAVRILPCSMNPQDSLRQWHSDGEIPENAVALSWTALSGKTRNSKGRLKVEAKVIGEDDSNAWWIMTDSEFERGSVSFTCYDEEHRNYYIRHNNAKIDACVEEVGSSGFKEAASFNLLIRSDCDPRTNRNGSSVMNISIDPSVLEDYQRGDNNTEASQRRSSTQEDATDALIESGIADDSPDQSAESELAELPVSHCNDGDDDTDAVGCIVVAESVRSQKRTREVRSAGKKKKKSGDDSTPEAKPSDPKKRRDSMMSVDELLVSGRIDRVPGRASAAHDSVFDLTLDHDDAADLSRIDPAPDSAAVYEELEETRRALQTALNKDIESQETIKLLRKQLDSARRSGKDSREIKQLRKELEKVTEESERAGAEAREMIKTLQQELELELQAKDEALNRSEALVEKLDTGEVEKQEAACTIKSLKKELKQKSERLQVLQRQRDDEAKAEGGHAEELARELEALQKLQNESQEVIKSLRSELESEGSRLRKLREELEAVKGGVKESTAAVRAELEAAEEARDASKAKVAKLEAELSDERAVVAELREEQDAANARWQEIEREKQGKEAEVQELMKRLKSLESLPGDLQIARARMNKAEEEKMTAELEVFGLESKIELLEKRLEEREQALKEKEEAATGGAAAGKPPLPPSAAAKSASSNENRRKSHEVRSRLSVEMDEAVAGMLGVTRAATAEPVEAGEMEKCNNMILELQMEVKKRDEWLDECEEECQMWKARYEHKKEQLEEGLAKYRRIKEELEEAEEERTGLKAEAQRLSMELGRVCEAKEELERTVQQLKEAGASASQRPLTRTTATSTSVTMRSLTVSEQRLEALKTESAKLKHDVDSFENVKRAVEARAESAEKKLDFLRKEKKELEGALEMVTDELTVVAAERTRLLHAHSQAQDELKALKTGIAGVSDYNAAIKEAMRDAQRSARACHDHNGDEQGGGTVVGVMGYQSAETSKGFEVQPQQAEEPPTVKETFQAARKGWQARANTVREAESETVPEPTEVPSAKTPPKEPSVGGGQQAEGVLSPLSVRMSELPQCQPTEKESDKENAPVEIIHEESEADVATDDEEQTRDPLKPSNSQPKITPLNPGVTPSKIGKPRNPGVIPGLTPLTISKPHRVRQMAQAFTASACAAAQSPKKPLEPFPKPQTKNPVSFRMLGKFDGKPEE
ncbi:hypothetical protein FOL47_003048 [Perkinsus chesapeaki]|uniref:Uncharacterized protein n=1 Tax=Perkinsus chesapeaki TaxID=330153 RepID=A0A7J6MAM3_PERCH|nr:hypothetical protein FOL47_003048 [Perkinsus chesapeaki]